MKHFPLDKNRRGVIWGGPSVKGKRTCYKPCPITGHEKKPKQAVGPKQKLNKEGGSVVIKRGYQLNLKKARPVETVWTRGRVRGKGMRVGVENYLPIDRTGKLTSTVSRGKL